MIAFEGRARELALAHLGARSSGAANCGSVVHADGGAVDADKDDAGDDEQRLPARPNSVEQRDHHIDQEVVGEDDQMAARWSDKCRC